MHLVRVAQHVLEDDAPAAEATVAIAALVTAVQAGLNTAGSVASLLWTRVERSPSAPWASDAADAVGKIANRGLVEKIVTAVMSGDSGRDLRSAGLSALAVPHAAALVLDNELLAMAETTTDRLAYDLVHVVVSASETRKIEPTTIKMLIARWRSHDHSCLRIAACDLLELVAAEERQKMIEHALTNDPSVRVRGYCALKLMDLVSPELAASIIHAALSAEEHEAVRDDLRRALADLRECHGIGRLSL